jgi:hypothetical protein
MGPAATGEPRRARRRFFSGLRSRYVETDCMELFYSDEEYLLVQELARGVRDYFAFVQSYFGR